jgi:asparagine synthase (glutamine-hydrolysing)
MCGVVGYYLNTSINSGVLDAMARSIQHRGPDSQGLYEKDQIGLGHRRLSIIDLSDSANQPMESHNGRYVIVFNGEIYNFKELKAKYYLDTKTAGDTEVILELFAKIGPDCVQEFNGMFVFIIWDKVTKKMYIFRDRLGKKPLYYSIQEGNFYFSSELKALTLSLLALKKTTNSIAVQDFLHLGYIPEPLTIFKEFFKFPSASWGVYDGTELKISKYWKLSTVFSSPKIYDEELATNSLKELLHTSVAYRLISDVPFGTFLSGGIDSSLVTAIASKHVSQKLNTFSIGFNDAKHNESHFAEAVAKHLNTNHHQFMVTEKEALNLVGEMAHIYDEPFSDSSALPTMLVSKLARKHVTVTLSGDGGDELFLGYGAYVWAKRLGNPFVNALRKPIGGLLSLGNNRFKRASELFQYSNDTERPSHIFSQEQYLFSRKEIQDMMVSPLPISLLFDSIEKPNRLSFPEWQSYFDEEYYLKDDLLVKVDRASMKYSLETRCPLLDFRLVEFAFSLDENLRWKEGVSKYLLKKVLYEMVPKQLFNRPKWGFSIPLGKWLQTDLKFLIDTYLNKDEVESAGWVKVEFVESLKSRFFKGEEYLYNRLWLLIILHKFKKEFA